MLHLVRISTVPSVPGLYLNLTGAAETAAKIAIFGRAVLKLVSQGEGIADEALEVIKLVEIGGNVLVAIGVLVDEGRLIKEAYNGTQQRPDLQKWAVNLISHPWFCWYHQSHRWVVCSSFHYEANAAAGSYYTQLQGWFQEHYQNEVKVRGVG